MSHEYATSGLLPPLGGARYVFRLGSTIPVKLRVMDRDGVSIGDLSPQVHFSLLNGPEVGRVLSSSAADSGSTIRFSGTAGGQYLFDLSTKRSQLAGQDLPPGTYHLWVTAPGFPAFDATIELTK